ncbi:peptide release factor, putative [Plasmodium gallinaceum]|uniref:Peptide release factor, putative n=1 Tax=Plasmodium gallinaceum TaxID=5849 RepID=A0A1J1H002_PLAGA|nr:peptide release factor, putative [Plasmodium gallinaceum]CRG96874.1 peptide release factor, putative [Plasmodium gallinaceum]
MGRHIKILNKLFFIRRYNFCSTNLTYLKNKQKELLIELADKSISDVCENKETLKIKKIQKTSKIFKSLYEELNIYKQLLMESINDKEEFQKKIMNDDDIKQLNNNIQNIQDTVIEDIIDFYKNFVNDDHHLDTNEIKMEITAGVGGLESKLFCKELFNMYENFCKIRNYEYELKNKISDDIKGNKSIVAYIKGKNVYEDFVQEIGIHRVQRIPINSKKIQTSTSIVLIFDEKSKMDKIKKKINFSKKDLVIETKRSGGAGGQSVNKNETCVKVIHKPTNIFVEVQKTSSQIQNKSIAIELLKNKLYNFYYEQERINFLKDKKNQKQSGDRSEKIRTYNFLHNVVIDHVANVEFSDIEKFFKGDHLIHLINKKKQIFYQNIIEETLKYIFSSIDN